MASSSSLYSLELVEVLNLVVQLLVERSADLAGHASHAGVATGHDVGLGALAIEESCDLLQT